MNVITEQQTNGQTNERTNERTNRTDMEMAQNKIFDGCPIGHGHEIIINQCYKMYRLGIVTIL